MIGLGAITANNGWAMAVTGAIIVMCGLSILSLIISQLHKFIALFEKKPRVEAAPRKEPAPTMAHLSAEVDILNDLEAAVRIFKSLTLDEGDSFELAKLYALCNNEEIPHPHLTIRALRDAGYLLPTGDGKYFWK